MCTQSLILGMGSKQHYVFCLVEIHLGCSRSPGGSLKAQFMSGVFAHLDVAQAVRLVWSHTVVSSISPG